MMPVLLVSILKVRVICFVFAIKISICINYVICCVQMEKLPLYLHVSTSEKNETIEKMFGINLKHFSKLENTEENNLQKTCYPIRHVLECDKPMEYLELFYIPGKVLGKYAWLFDVIGPDLHQSCCFTKAYGHYVEGTGSVLCPFSPETIAEKFEKSLTYTLGSSEHLETIRSLK